MAVSAYEVIATTTVATATSAVNFSSISQAYTDLVAVVKANDSNGYLLVRFNSDSSSLYSRTYLTGNGSSISSSRGTGEAQGYTTADTTTNLSNVGLLNIMNYSNTTTFKTFLGRENLPASSVQATIGLYRSTSAISTVSFLSPSATATIAVGSTFTLYGIKAA
jgi:hypothetical protein